jgi:uncharacterized Zn finger protein
VPARAPARAPVSIADRVARSFPPLACVHGYGYFSSRHVQLAVRSETEVDADVKGKRTQSVKLRIEDGRLGASCTCAAEICGPAACRHVWAALLEVDRQGALGSLRSSQRVLALAVIEPTTTTKAEPAKPKLAAAKTAATKSAKPKPKVATKKAAAAKKRR